MPTPKIPWQKIKELILQLSGQVWDDEEKEMRRIIDGIKDTADKVITVSFSHTIDCSQDAPTVKTKISFSEKFQAEASGSVDDPAQMVLGEKPVTADDVPDKKKEPAATGG